MTHQAGPGRGGMGGMRGPSIKEQGALTTPPPPGGGAGRGAVQGAGSSADSSFQHEQLVNSSAVTC